MWAVNFCALLVQSVSSWELYSRCQITRMKISPANIKAFYLLPIRLLAVAIGVYHSNRNRLRILMARPRLAAALKFAIVVTSLVWLLVVLIASDDESNRLSEAIKQMWSQSTSDGPALKND